MSEFRTKLNTQLAQKEKETASLLKLLDIYPDLSDKGSTRWESNILTSNRAIKDMVDVDFRHSCGCCPGAPLMAQPYIILGGQVICAPKVWYYIGERCSWACGEIPKEGWEEDIRNHGFRNEIIEKIRTYFKKNEPIEDDGEGYSGPD